MITALFILSVMFPNRIVLFFIFNILNGHFSRNQSDAD